MERIGVSELHQNLTGVLKRVKAGQVIMITSRGNEVARLVPPEHTRQTAIKNRQTATKTRQTATKTRQTAREKLQQLRQTAIVGDVLSPIETEWEVMK